MSSSPHPPVREVVPGGLASLARSGRPVRLALAGSLALLLLHAWHYAFLTDDAYISFRYARNLAEGAGLVFNPGYEAVEGYTNFLWVLLLAGLDRLGAAPDRAALPLSLACTVGLWAVTAVCAARFAPRGRAGVAAAIATGWLAATPSVAVWSTGGLETRLFELLVLSAVLRLLVEDARLACGDPARPLAALVFALATLTRPDGLLISGCALGASVLLRLRSLRARLHWTVASAALYAGVVGAHYAFRRLYYGEWLPNTWYAKVSGQSWWDLGFRYLETFALEHALYLWVPLLAAGAIFQWRSGRALLPLVFAAVCLPHALYVASVGGDHFEFRPVDLYFPFAFLLMTWGALWLCRGVRSTAAVAALVAVVAAVSCELPWRSHVGFPDRYVPSFPGGREDSPLADAYLSPARAVLYRAPGLAAVAARHRELIDHVTRHYAALRREEHALFLEQVMAEGRALRRLVARGVLPVDTYIGVCCVGAIPYISRLRTLDRIGLTDAAVARGEVSQPQLVAHARSASREYARERGVDFWSLDPVRLLFNGRDPQFAHSLRGMYRMRYEAWVAPVGEHLYLLADLLQGLPAARLKFPGLDFRSLRDRGAVERTLRELGADPHLEEPRVRPGS